MLIIFRYCGTKVPPVLTSLGNRLTIIFKTDHSVALDGFMLNYISLSKSQGKHNLCYLLVLINIQMLLLKYHAHVI